MVTNSETRHVAATLAHQVHRAILDHDAADAAGREAVRRILASRIDTLVDEASWHPAGSAEAALLFASVLAGEIEAVEQGEEAGEARLQRMYRLAISLLQFLERTSDIAREELRLEWFHPRHFDALAFGKTGTAVAA